MAEGADQQTEVSAVLAKATALGEQPSAVTAIQRLDIHNEALRIGGLPFALSISTLIDVTKEKKLTADDRDRMKEMLVGALKPGGSTHYHDNSRSGDVNTQVVNAKQAAPVFAPKADSVVNSPPLLSDLRDATIASGGSIVKSEPPKVATNNPWISGSFYLVMTLMVLGMLLAIAKVVSWWALPLVLVGSVLIICIVGAFQLRNDAKLSEVNFLKLMEQTFKGLPLIRSLGSRTPPPPVG